MVTARAFNGGFAPQMIREALSGRSRLRLSDLYEMALREDVLTTAQMSVLMQDGLRAIMFDSFAGQPSSWEQFTARETSNKEVETWLELGRIGTLSTVGETERYPRVRPELLLPRQIRNYKYGDILAISEEMLKFDRVGLIRQLAGDQGARAAQTITEAVFTALTTAGNYIRTSADNDVGNNTNATTFGAAGLITAITTLTTMKDRVSGRYLGIRPDTLIVGPALEFAAKQLIFGNVYNRQGGNTTNEIYGTGTNNPFASEIRNLIVDPYMARVNANNWVLGQARRGLVYQEVEPVQILQATAQSADNEEYFESDVFRYRVRVWFGTGFTDDRYWYYSSSTTPPVVG